jgi:hypothetical protein
MKIHSSFQISKLADFYFGRAFALNLLGLFTRRGVSAFIAEIEG